MMKYIKRFFLIIISIQMVLFGESGMDKKINDKEIPIEKIRMVYYAGVEEEDYIDSLSILVEENFGKDTSNYSAIGLAYKGGIEALKSKHAFWPFTKMSYLNDSMDFFEKAIQNEPGNLEIRFMRFSILYHVPDILGYSDEEEDDLQIIYDLLLQNKFRNVNFEIKEGIIDFILDSEMLTSEQENKLRNRLVFADE